MSGKEKQQEASTPARFDYEIHTPLNPYCGDMTCWCRANVQYHEQVTRLPLDDEVDMDTFHFALSFLLGQ